MRGVTQICLTVSGYEGFIFGVGFIVVCRYTHQIYFEMFKLTYFFELTKISDRLLVSYKGG